MSNLGILTYYYRSRNIGGLLQSYALVYFLQKNSYFAQQICFDYGYITSQVKSLRETLFSIQPNKSIISRLKQMLSVRILKQYFPLFVIQNRRMKEFELFISHSNNTYTDETIQFSNSQYEIFVIGSDQVWGHSILPFTAYFGEFTTPDKKVISYAASSDCKQFPFEAEKLFVQKLEHLNAISVREKTLKEYIERISDKKATVVLDPTFLLSPQEWLQIANPTAVPKKPYIFCYFLGGKSAWQRQKAQEYADTYGYEVVHLPYIMRNIRPNDRFLKGQGRYDVGPREFIALIANASCIFTDSFHGMAFSINFGKNFYVFNRDDECGPNSMNARITDTLTTFCLPMRHITDKKAVLNNSSVDFTEAHKILAHEKEKSINWLLNALKD